MPFLVHITLTKLRLYSALQEVLKGGLLVLKNTRWLDDLSRAGI